MRSPSGSCARVCPRLIALGQVVGVAQVAPAVELLELLKPLCEPGAFCLVAIDARPPLGGTVVALAGALAAVGLGLPALPFRVGAAARSAGFDFLAQHFDDRCPTPLTFDLGGRRPRRA
jgi:hypothetical protein